MKRQNDNPLYRHHSSDCEVLAVTNVPSPFIKKKTMAPLSVEKGLAARDELRYDKKAYPNRAEKMKYYVGPTIYFAGAICALWALAIRRSSGCGDDLSALASTPFIVTFFAMSAMPYVFVLRSGMLRSAAAVYLYVCVLTVAFSILIFSTWGMEAIKPKRPVCMKERTYDAGICTVVDVNNTEDIEWMKTCKVFGKRDYAFMYKGGVEKYRADMVAFHDTYEQLKGIFNETELKEIFVDPVDKGLPSMADMLICNLAFMPCSASCMPIKPCKTFVRDGLKKMIRHGGVQNVIEKTCNSPLGDLSLTDIEFFLSLGGFDESVTRLLKDYFRGLSESCESASKYLVADTHIDEFASSGCATISNYTTAYDFERTFKDGKCTENAYLKAKHMLDEKKTTREKSLSDWEKRALISVVAAYGILLIAAFTISARVITLMNKEPRGKRTVSIMKHNTAASVVCSFIVFAFGICILAISLGYFLSLKDSLIYVYGCLSVGLYAIYAAFSTLLLAPLQVDADKSTTENASKFQRCLAYAAYICETYKQKFGVAGEWFLHGAIIKELVEVSLQTSGLFHNAPTQDALITAASCSTLALNCLLSPYGYVRQQKDAVIFCDGICDISYAVIRATRIVVRNVPISFKDALLLLFPMISTITILKDYAVFSIKAKFSDKSHGISRRMSTVLRLPSHNFSRHNSARKIYKLLLFLFFLCGCAICGISGYTLFRCVSQHLKCSKRYSSCLWRAALPRKYFQQGIFGETSCGENHVILIRSAGCIHNKSDMQSIHFEKFANMTTLQLGNVSLFPPSLISLMRSEPKNVESSSLIVTAEILPDALDFSNQGIDDFPEPMKKLLGAYEKTNVKSLNLSGNALDSATLLEWLNSMACSEDRSRGFCELRTIDASRNVLSDIPFVGLNNTRFPKLSKIIAQENNIYKINTQTAELTMNKMAAIDLGNNNISEITLNTVDADSRDFESLLDLLSQVANLDNIALVSLLSITGLEGGISGIINASLRLRKLKTLSVTKSDLGGDNIPSEIGMLSTLDAFNVVGAAIAGSIPSQLGQLTKLTSLSLTMNSLTVPSPLSWAN